MNKRLVQFLSAEGLNQAQFADRIGVARASISHILSGRNNPGYDFIINIAKEFPELSIDWLLLGKGRMYKQSETSSAPAVTAAELPPVSDRMVIAKDEDDLFSLAGVRNADESPVGPAEVPETDEIACTAQKGKENSQFSIDMDTSYNRTKSIVKQRNIDRIIVFFDDGTFTEFK